MCIRDRKWLVLKCIKKEELRYTLSELISTTVMPVSYTHLDVYKRQVKIGPVDEDFKEGGLQFIDEVKGGNIPKEFIPSVQKDVYKRQIQRWSVIQLR